MKIPSGIFVRNLLTHANNCFSTITSTKKKIFRLKTFFKTSTRAQFQSSTTPWATTGRNPLFEQTYAVVNRQLV